MKQEKRDEKRLNKERKLEQRRLELEMAKELKKPNEDMCLADQKVMYHVNHYINKFEFFCVLIWFLCQSCHYESIVFLAAAAAKLLQSCPTLCDPIDGSPPGSPLPGILQARTQEWVAISFSSAWKWKVKGKSLSRVWLLATPWTTAYQAPLPMGFSRQEY